MASPGGVGMWPSLYPWRPGLTVPPPLLSAQLQVLKPGPEGSPLLPTLKVCHCGDRLPSLPPDKEELLLPPWPSLKTRKKTTIKGGRKPEVKYRWGKRETHTLERVKSENEEVAIPKQDRKWWGCGVRGSLRRAFWDFPGGPGVKNPPANAGDTVRSLAGEDSTRLRATKPVHHQHWSCALEPGSPKGWRLRAATPEAHRPERPGSATGEVTEPSPRAVTVEWPLLSTTRESPSFLD